MTTEATLITFIIPVRNDAARLARCLQTIRDNASYAGVAKCLVVDNGSTDDSAAVARAAGATVLPLPGLKVAALRNRAVAATRSPHLAFVDADHEITPNWITAALDDLNDSRVGAAGAHYLSPPAGSWTQRVYGLLRGRTNGRREVGWLSSGNLAVRREAFDQIHGFDEALETCEDVDLCQRLRHAGWQVIGDERLVSVHMGDPRTLRELFRSERWRGRDNLRVSLRFKPELSEWPSILIPVFQAAAWAVFAAGIAAALFGEWRLALAGAAGVLVALGLSAARAVRIVQAGALTGIDILRALAVAITYDAGRACALIAPAGHRRSRPTSTPEPR